MITSAISAAIRLHSAAVAPDVLCTKLRTSLGM
jgi:hypothetical protein